MFSVLMLIPDPSLPPRIRKEAKSLVRHGARVCVVGWDCQRDYPALETVDGIPVKRIHHRASRGTLTLGFGLVGFYAKVLSSLLRADFDVLHCCRFDMLLPGLLVAKLRRKKTVYDAYEYYSMMVGNHFSGLARKGAVGLVSAIEEMLSRAVDLIFTVDTVGDVLLKRFQRVNRHTMVLQNVPERSNIEEDPDLMHRYAHQPVLFYAGGLSRRKGVFEMLDVLYLVKAECPDVKLLLAGEFVPESLEKEVRAYVENHGLSENVMFLGFLPYERVCQYARTAAVGLHLYHPDPYQSISRGSSKLFMYMQSALPIVVSDLPGIGGLVRDTDSGIPVDPHRPEKMAQAVLSLLNDPQEAWRLGDNGYRAFQETYNWEVEESRFLSAYETLRI